MAKKKKKNQGKGEKTKRVLPQSSLHGGRKVLQEHAGKGIDSVWLYLFAHWWSQCLGHRGKVMRSRLFPGHAVRPCPKEEQGKKGRQKEKWGRERRGSERERSGKRGSVRR